MKYHYKVTLIDRNGVGEIAEYRTDDVISLFMVLAKEIYNRESRYSLKKLIIEIEDLK